MATAAELDRIANAARRGAMPAFIEALRADPDLLEQATDRLRICESVILARGEAACWVTTKMRETLRAALAAANITPDVPAGRVNV